MYTLIINNYVLCVLGMSRLKEIKSEYHSYLLVFLAFEVL